MYKILLVEDDAGIAKEIADYASHGDSMYILQRILRI